MEIRIEIHEFRGTQHRMTTARFVGDTLAASLLAMLDGLDAFAARLDNDGEAKLAIASWIADRQKAGQLKELTEALNYARKLKDRRDLWRQRAEQYRVGDVVPRADFARVQAEADKARTQRDNARAERDELRAEVETLRSQRDAALSEACVLRGRLGGWRGVAD